MSNTALKSSDLFINPTLTSYVACLLGVCRLIHDCLKRSFSYSEEFSLFLVRGGGVASEESIAVHVLRGHRVAISCWPSLTRLHSACCLGLRRVLVRRSEKHSTPGLPHAPSQQTSSFPPAQADQTGFRKQPGIHISTWYHGCQGGLMGWVGYCF